MDHHAAVRHVPRAGPTVLPSGGAFLVRVGLLSWALGNFLALEDLLAAELPDPNITLCAAALYVASAWTAWDSS